jgi:hypothetical protein
MTKIFYPTSEKLRFLLESIHNREVALPDFQRDFVWDPRATEELIESICQNFPAGSLLRIKNSVGFYFAPREFAGAPGLNGHQPTYLILDGQQRLTSMYQAFYGTGSHRYFVDLGKLLGGSDLEDAVFFERKRDAEKRFGTLEQQASGLVFPFASLFGRRHGFEAWLDQVLELRPESEADKKTLRQRLREARDKWLETVEDYEFPVVTLEEHTSADAVCTIFETLNRTGVKLSVFDLLAARFWSQEVRLRDLWVTARIEHPIIEEFEVDPYYVLQAIAVFASRGAPSCKRSEVLKMGVEQIHAGWKPVVDGLAESLQLLRDDCGVVLPQWLPYFTILIPMASIMAFASGKRGPEVGAVRRKLEQWFWCSVFAQAYEKAPNSQAVEDFGELKRWIEGGAPPATVVKFSFDPSLLRQTTPRQRALYRGVMALVLRHGALDLHSGERITAAMILEKKIEDHHVFPQEYLAEQRPDVGVIERDCVLNRTLIDKKTNGSIWKKAPSTYLGEIELVSSANQLRRTLEAHLLPAGEGSSLRQDRFDEFLEERQKLIGHQIQELTK